MRIEYPQSQEENLALGLWVMERIPGFRTNNFRTLAFFEQNVGIKGVVLFQNYRETDIEIVFAAEPNSDWARRDLILEALSYPFRIGCHRVTAIVRKDNRKARKLVERLGFKQEGKLRKADTDGHDLFIYGLLADECKLARKNSRVIDNGKEIRPACANAA